LPGVGPKSAQRMTLHLLERDRDGASHLATVLQAAVERIGRCSQCRNLTEDEVCSICSDSQRDPAILCIVENPSDVIAIEQATGFRGKYFVLMGHLSPLDGIGPDDLGLDLLEVRLGRDDLLEMIIATNPTVEGEATAYYLKQIASRQGVSVSRIAHGVPLGGELEYIDHSTLQLAFNSRQSIAD
jgi:recombination protein RecR